VGGKAKEGGKDGESKGRQQRERAKGEREMQQTAETKRRPASFFSIHTPCVCVCVREREREREREDL
jgi:hypothetical protein